MRDPNLTRPPFLENDDTTDTPPKDIEGTTTMTTSKGDAGQHRE